MKLQFIAHATFRIELDDGRVIVVDPYLGMSFQGRFNYPPYRTRADYAVITHDHLDHNYTGDLSGDPVVVRHEADFDGLCIRSICVWHDRFEGTKFGGAVDMKVIEADGVRLLHMGDCGEELTKERVGSWGHFDVVLIPCGGFYTMDGVEAARVATMLDSDTVIPCHYKTPLCSLPIVDETAFCEQFDHVTRIHSSVFVPGSHSGVVVLRPLMCEAPFI